MADTTPYAFPDASPADQLRYLKQQYAAAAKSQRIRAADGREREMQSLTALAAEIDKLEKRLNGTGGVVVTSHGRR